MFVVCRVRNCRQTRRMTTSPTKMRGLNLTKRKTTKPRSVCLSVSYSDTCKKGEGGVYPKNESYKVKF